MIRTVFRCNGINQYKTSRQHKDKYKFSFIHGTDCSDFSLLGFDTVHVDADAREGNLLLPSGAKDKVQF